MWPLRAGHSTDCTSRPGAPLAAATERTQLVLTNCLLTCTVPQAVTNLLFGFVVNAHPFLSYELCITLALPEHAMAILQLIT